ncbi:hypothetical protein [Tahibacter caeni]|uniref:hypothetical protein n=1 Tax=Tahibacter caeni TaxID=1453545 RepID=UPI002147D96B|nr:hypothetical protein [Tahibacter caeni]
MSHDDSQGGAAGDGTARSGGCRRAIRETCPRRVWLQAMLAAALMFAGAGAQAGRSASAAYPWTDFDDLFVQARQRSGLVRIYRLSLDRAGVATLLLQNPRQPDYVDRYGYDEGEFTGPEPVKFSRYPSLAEIERQLIPREDVDFGRLPALADLACDAANLPDANVDGIVLERGDADGHAPPATPVWTFRLRDAARSADVYFSLDGRILHVVRH